MNIMSICFTWVPIRWFRRTQNITSIGLFYKNWRFYLEECLTVKNQWELLTGGDVSDLVWSIGV